MEPQERVLIVVIALGALAGIVVAVAYVIASAS
jgi:hypothetical protein